MGLLSLDFNMDLGLILSIYLGKSYLLNIFNDSWSLSGETWFDIVILVSLYLFNFRPVTACLFFPWELALLDRWVVAWCSALSVCLCSSRSVTGYPSEPKSNAKLVCGLAIYRGLSSNSLCRALLTFEGLGICLDKISKSIVLLSFLPDFIFYSWSGKLVTYVR